MENPMKIRRFFHCKCCSRRMVEPCILMISINYILNEVFIQEKCVRRLWEVIITGNWEISFWHAGEDSDDIICMKSCNRIFNWALIFQSLSYIGLSTLTTSLTPLCVHCDGQISSVSSHTITISPISWHLVLFCCTYFGITFRIN